MPGIGGRSGQPVEVKLPRLGKGLGNSIQTRCKLPAAIPCAARAASSAPLLSSRRATHSADRGHDSTKDDNGPRVRGKSVSGFSGKTHGKTKSLSPLLISSKAGGL